jgi:hypothetical protein
MTLLRRLAEAHDLLRTSDWQYHADTVLAACERIESDAKRLRRAKLRIARLQQALAAECKARDQSELGDK